MNATEYDFETVLDREPNNADIRRIYADFLAETGRPEEEIVLQLWIADSGIWLDSTLEWPGRTVRWHFRHQGRAYQVPVTFHDRQAAEAWLLRCRQSRRVPDWFDAHKRTKGNDLFGDVEDVQFRYVPMGGVWHLGKFGPVVHNYAPYKNDATFRTPEQRYRRAIVACGVPRKVRNDYPSRVAFANTNTSKRICGHCMDRLHSHVIDCARDIVGVKPQREIVEIATRTFYDAHTHLAASLLYAFK